VSQPAVSRRLLARLLLLALAGAPATFAAAQGRPARDADSLLAALRATQGASIVRVLETPPRASSEWQLEVLDPLRSEPSGPRLRLAATAGGCGADQRAPEPGTLALLLLRRSAAGWVCDAHYRASHVALAPDERAQTAELVRGALGAIESGASESEGFAAFLRGHVGIANPTLRRGVLFDLAPRLDADDLAFLLDLTGPGHPDDVRAWAVVSLSGVTQELPAEIAGLLTASESERVREAVLQLLGSRRQARDLPLFERALGDESAALRRVAVDNLVVPESVPLLLGRFAREPDAAVQAAIVRKLGEIGGPAAADGLASIAEHTADAGLRREAELWLAAVRERGAAR
jgi:hypothetical protein